MFALFSYEYIHIKLGGMAKGAGTSLTVSVGNSRYRGQAEPDRQTGSRTHATRNVATSFLHTLVISADLDPNDLGA